MVKLTEHGCKLTFSCSVCQWSDWSFPWLQHNLKLGPIRLMPSRSELAFCGHKKTVMRQQQSCSRGQRRWPLRQEIIEIIILIRSVIGKKSYRQWLYAELCGNARNGLIETLRSIMAIASRSSHPSPPILVGSHHDNGPAWSSNTAHTFTVDKHETPF